VAASVPAWIRSTLNSVRSVAPTELHALDY
jgi:hypothetical protein